MKITEFLSNKLYRNIMIGIMIITVGIAVRWINNYLSMPDDNMFEESCEQIIYGTTGKEIDFTPSSQEDEDNDTLLKRKTRW